MAEINLKLTDKTVLVAGKFTLCLQNIASKFTESGANVVLLTDEPKMAQRFCQSLSDLREVSEQYGNAVTLDETLKNDQSQEHYFSRTAELFGTADLYIDMNLYNFDLPLMCESIPDKFKNEFKTHYLNFQKMTAAAIKFIRTRSRGRIITLFHELDQLTCGKAGFDGYRELTQHIQTTASEICGPPHHTSFNAIAVGVNEEYLIARYPKMRTIQTSLAELNKTFPQARLVEHNDISNLVLYLASPLSTGVNGQILHLNHGL